MSLSTSGNVQLFNQSLYFGNFHSWGNLALKKLFPVFADTIIARKDETPVSVNFGMLQQRFTPVPHQNFPKNRMQI